MLSVLILYYKICCNIYIYILLYFLLELPTYQSVDQEFKRIVFGWLHLIIVPEIPSISTIWLLEPMSSGARSSKAS